MKPARVLIRRRISSVSRCWGELEDPASCWALFKRDWFAVVDDVPADLDIVRYWDLAATEKTEFNDPDWTVGVKLGRNKNGGYCLRLKG